MKLKMFFVAALLVSTHSVRAETPAESPRASMKKAVTMTSPEYQQTIADIRATLGLVPTFLTTYPQSALPGAWALFKGVQLNPQTAIPVKYKELMGLAIASQIPCHYCTYFHTTAAKFNGATEQEVQEAVALGGIARQWSTYMNGTQADMDDFEDDVDTFISKAKRETADSTTPPAWTTAMNFNTPEEAYADIENSLGSVPEFMKDYPREGIVGAWKQLKAVSFNPNTAIPAKYKDLISLGVSSQIPCTYCIYFDTEAARLNGATDVEIKEAVALASIVRTWSTVLNGMQTNEAQFKKEMTQVFKNAAAAKQKQG